MCSCVRPQRYTLVSHGRIYVTKKSPIGDHTLWNTKKITKVTFRHEGVLKIIFPRNLEHYFSRWKMKKKLKLRCWKKKKKNVQFSIFRLRYLFSKSSRFFRFSVVFQKFQDFQICSDIFRFVFQNFEIFRFFIFQKFRICQPNKLKNRGNT